MSDEKWEYALDGFDLRDFNCADIEASMQRRGGNGHIGDLLGLNKAGREEEGGKEQGVPHGLIL